MFYLCLDILAARKRVNKLFQAHLIRYLIFVKLMLEYTPLSAFYSGLLYLRNIPLTKKRQSPYSYYKFACLLNIIRA